MKRISGVVQQLKNERELALVTNKSSGSTEALAALGSVSSNEASLSAGGRRKTSLAQESAMGKAKGRQTEANNIGSRPQKNRSRAKSEVGKSEERRQNDRGRVKGECKSRVASGHLVV